jgi:hypothetical protein
VTGAAFLAAAIAAGIAGLVVAWLIAGHLPPPAPRPVDQARAHDPSWPPNPAALSAAYRAQIARARQQSTGQLLATHHTVAQLVAPTVDELLAWAAAHHVLVAERGHTPRTSGATR